MLLLLMRLVGVVVNIAAPGDPLSLSVFGVFTNGSPVGLPYYSIRYTNDALCLKHDEDALY
jgi:hypothetical protein